MPCPDLGRLRVGSFSPYCPRVSARSFVSKRPSNGCSERSLVIPPLEERPIKPPDLHADDRSEVDKLPTNCAEDPMFLTVLAATSLYSQEETPDHRLRTSTAAFHEIMSAPDKGIPKDLCLVGEICG